jgi:tRNA pseudouridine55 synthase
MDGVLVIDKPAGPTSHDVVACVRRALGAARVGHTGTLDPMATGVLPLVVGRATRLARFLSSDEKEYEAVVRLGQDTDTGDATGRTVAAEPDAPVGPDGPGPATADRGAITLALAGFAGSYLQTPPAYSAKKVGGVRAYALARRGQAVEPRPVRVTARTVELLDVDGLDVRVHVVCSAGFYVRALARDLGRTLGTGAHLAALRRLRSGPFAAEDSVKLEQVEAEGAAAARRLVPLHSLLTHLPSLVLTGDGLRQAMHGKDVGASGIQGGRLPDAFWPPYVRLFDPAGLLVALAEPADRPGFLHPAVVVV